MEEETIRENMIMSCRSLTFFLKTARDCGDEFYRRCNEVFEGFNKEPSSESLLEIKGLNRQYSSAYGKVRKEIKSVEDLIDLLQKNFYALNPIDDAIMNTLSGLDETLEDERATKKLTIKYIKIVNEKLKG